MAGTTYSVDMSPSKLWGTACPAAVHGAAKSWARLAD